MTALPTPSTPPGTARALAAVPATPARPVVRVILYRRISNDPREREGGIKRQDTDIRSMCALLSATTGEDWVVVRVVTDNDRSNSVRAKKPRESFGALLAEMEAGTTGADAVAFFDQDRFVKEPTEWARWMSTTFKPGLRMRVAIVGRGEEDVTSPEFFMNSTFRMMTSTVDTLRQSKRIRSFTAEQRARGKVGGRVNYGWRRVLETDAQGYKVDWHDELHPEHSEVVRECARRIRAGESGMRIARDLTARGVPVPSAGRKREAAHWTVATVHRLVVRPVNVGLRIEEDGTETAITLPPILKRSEWMWLCAHLSDPKRRTMTDTRTVHLLSNLAICGLCDGPMRRRSVNKKGGPWLGYVCRDHSHLGIRQSDTDAYVVTDVVKWLTRINPADLVNDGGAAQQAAEDLEVLEAEWSAYVAASERPLRDPLRVSGSELERHRSALVPQIESARCAANTDTTLAGMDAAARLARMKDVRGGWDALPLDVRRSIISALFTVRILPADPKKSRRSVDLDRIVVKRRGA